MAMARSVQDARSASSRPCNSLQTVCERSANVLSAERVLQQFVNRVQPIVNLGPAKMGLKQPNNPVVEHKGNVQRLVCFSGVSALWYGS